MKNRLFLVVTFLVSFFSTLAQEKTVYYQKTLKETMYVHYNSSLFFVGDNILYKTYSIRNRSKKLSGLSKIAYVELVGDNKQAVFKHTVKLVKGVGTGNFLIPNTIKTGHYKLVAYTQWMRNEGEKNLFYGDIVIINPKLKNERPSVLLLDTLNVKNDKLIVISSQEKRERSKNNNELLELKIQQEDYNKRSKVILEITHKQKIEGNYSLSVRKIDNFTTPNKYTPYNYQKKQLENSLNNQKFKAKFYPEFRGNILKGRVISKETKQPIYNTRVALSIPNKKFRFRFAITNKKGDFEFIFKEINKDPIGIIQIVDENKENYQLSLLKKQALSYSTFKNKEVVLLPEIEKEFLEYSIQNQIKSNYFVPNKATISNKDKLFGDFFQKKITTYLLDDYNRFTTLKETIIEIIKNVRVQKLKQRYSFFVKNSDEFDEIKETPLLLIDGVIIQNHTDVIDFDAKQIKSISVIRNKFYFEKFVFQGIIFIETFEKNFKKATSKNYIKSINLTTPIISNFDQKMYHKNTYKRIPDYRRQLYWKPNLTLSNKSTQFTFYTSDISGNFEIVLEGFTKQGTPVLITKTFTVQEKTTQ